MRMAQIYIIQSWFRCWDLKGFWRLLTVQFQFVLDKNNDCQTPNQIWFSRFGEWFIRNTNQINRIDCVLDPERIHAFLRGSMTPASLLLRCFPVLALDPSHPMSTSVFGARLKALQAETKMSAACGMHFKEKPWWKIAKQQQHLSRKSWRRKTTLKGSLWIVLIAGGPSPSLFLALKLPPCSWLHSGPMSKLENCSAQSPKSQFLSLQTVPRH